MSENTHLKAPLQVKPKQILQPKSSRMLWEKLKHDCTRGFCFYCYCLCLHLFYYSRRFRLELGWFCFFILPNCPRFMYTMTMQKPNLKSDHRLFRFCHHRQLIGVVHCNRPRLSEHIFLHKTEVSLVLHQSQTIISRMIRLCRLLGVE